MTVKHTKQMNAGCKKVIRDYHHDYLERQKITEEQRKAWKRKPYDFGGDKK